MHVFYRLAFLPPPAALFTSCISYWLEQFLVLLPAGFLISLSRFSTNQMSYQRPMFTSSSNVFTIYQLGQFCFSWTSYQLEHVFTIWIFTSSGSCVSSGMFYKSRQSFLPYGFSYQSRRFSFSSWIFTSPGSFFASNIFYHLGQLCYQLILKQLGHLLGKLILC